MEIAEVIEFMERVAPNAGDRFSPNRVKRKFRSGYADAEKAINELVELGYLEMIMKGSFSFYLRKRTERKVVNEPKRRNERTF